MASFGSPPLKSTTPLTVQKKPRAVGIGCTIIPSKQGMMVQKVLSFRALTLLCGVLNPPGQVLPDSRAFAAGVTESDIIVEVNNQPIRTLEDIMRCLQSRSEPVLKILRGSTGKSFNVTLSTLDIMRPMSTTSTATKTPFAMVFERRETGIVVTSVVSGGVADNGGIKPGDIIVQIGSEVNFKTFTGFFQ